MVTGPCQACTGYVDRLTSTINRGAWFHSNPSLGKPLPSRWMIVSMRITII
ncbi:hypothetical protein Hdeb2414_s0001g00003761 [Helianthus debilis subsp. tardiflorus]